MHQLNLQQFLQQSPLGLALQGWDAIYVSPNIPYKKRLGAQHYLPQHIQHDAILILVDDTVFGSAKAGLCITQDGLYYKTDFEELIYCSFDHIEMIRVNLSFMGSSIQLNQQLKLSFSQPDDQGLQALVTLLNAFVQQMNSQFNHTDQASGQDTRWFDSSSKLSAEQQQACHLLGLQPEDLNEASLKRAYRNKISEFHPDQYQQLPASVRLLIERQAQQLNHARDVLRRCIASPS